VDLLDRKPPLACEGLGDTAAATHEWREVGSRPARLFEHEGDDALRRACLVDWIVFVRPFRTLPAREGDRRARWPGFRARNERPHGGPPHRAVELGLEERGGQRFIVAGVF